MVCTISIYSKWKACYDITIILLNILYSMGIIYFFVFTNRENLPGWSKFVDLGVELTYVIYIITNFFQEYKDKATGQIIKAPKLIVKNYLTGWFIIDLISSIPFEYLTPNGRALVLLRLVRINKIFQFFDLVERVSFKMVHLVSMLRLGFTGVFGTFIFASLWFFLCHEVYDYKKKKGDTEDTFYGNYTLEKDFGEFDRLLISYYFTLTTLTTTGFGDYVPKAFIERIFAIILMLFGVLFFSFLMSLISDEMGNDFEDQNIHAQKLIADLKKYNRAKQDNFFNKKVNTNILDGIHFSVKKSRFEQLTKKYNFDILPKSVKIILTRHLWCDIFQDVIQYFELLEESKEVRKFLYKLSYNFQYKKYKPREVIFHPAYRVKELAIIHKGFVDICNPMTTLKKRLKPGEIMGHFYLLFNVQPKYVYTAVSSVELITVERKTFEKIVNKNPSVLHRLKKISMIRFRDIFNMISGTTYLSHKLGNDLFEDKKIVKIPSQSKLSIEEMDSQVEKDYALLKAQMNSFIKKPNYIYGNEEMNEIMMAKQKESLGLEKLIMKRMRESKGNLMIEEKES